MIFSKNLKLTLLLVSTLYSFKGYTQTCKPLFSSLSPIYSAYLEAQNVKRIKDGRLFRPSFDDNPLLQIRVFTERMIAGRVGMTETIPLSYYSLLKVLRDNNPEHDTLLKQNMSQKNFNELMQISKNMKTMKTMKTINREKFNLIGKNQVLFKANRQKALLINSYKKIDDSLHSKVLFSHLLLKNYLLQKKFTQLSVVDAPTFTDKTLSPAILNLSPHLIGKTILLKLNSSNRVIIGQLLGSVDNALQNLIVKEYYTGELILIPAQLTLQSDLYIKNINNLLQ